jgi:hypothetical protein
VRVSSVSDRIGDVTNQANARIAFVSARSIEVLAMRIHLERSNLRVALRAIALFVAGRAALHALAGGLAVTQQPERLGIVEARLHAAARAHAGLLVATLAEHGRIVATRALEVAAVRRAGMTSQEVG